VEVSTVYSGVLVMMMTMKRILGKHRKSKQGPGVISQVGAKGWPFVFGLAREHIRYVIACHSSLPSLSCLALRSFDSCSFKTHNGVVRGVEIIGIWPRVERGTGQRG
jgi:hypothetical protein